MTHASPHTNRTCLLLLLAALIWSMPAQGQAPKTMAYQGYLTDTAGEPLGGAVNLNFRLYDAPAGGTALWAEDQVGVPVSGGVFTVQLGAEEPLDGVAFDQPLWLAVRVDGGDELTPRVPLSAAPYALSARALRTVPGPETGDWPNVVLGEFGHTVEDDAEGGTIGGGGSNTVGSFFATVGGGQDNTADGARATVGGGLGNAATETGATVAGGIENVASGVLATVPGGSENQARGRNSFAAGTEARAAHNGTFVWKDLTTDSLVSTAANQFLIEARGGVGIGTNAPSSPLTVAGVVESTEGGFMFPDGTVQATAAGGDGSGAAWQLGGNAGTTPETQFLGTTDDVPLEIRVNGQRASRFVPAGDDDDAPNLIGGHVNNRVDEVGPGGFLPQGVTISGGGGGTPGTDTEANIAAGNYGTIGGGRGNRASDTATTVAGGQFNEALTNYDTVAGGRNNRAEGGGDFNSATVGGGAGNTASGEAATVAGGANNTASGNFSSVPGGRQNLAAGDGSVAAGLQARAAHDGAFVWADDSDAAFSSTAVNQFLIRARGGVGIGVNAPEGALHVTHPEDDMDLILGGAGEDALFGDDGMIASDPSLPSSDLLLISNDALGVILDADGDGDDASSEFIVADNGLDDVFRVDLSGTTSTGHLELEDDLGADGAPAEGGVYRDNVVYAWARVNADGSVAASFGCSVTRLGLGRYQVDYDQALPNGMAPVVTPLSANDPVIATAAPSGNDGATVVVFDFVGGQFQNGDRPFFLQVVGRP